MEIMLFQIWFFFMLLAMWHFLFGYGRSKFAFPWRQNVSSNKSIDSNKNNKVSPQENRKIEYGDVVELMGQIVEMDKAFLAKIKSNDYLNETQPELQKTLLLRMKTIEDLTQKYSVLFDYAQDECKMYALSLIQKHADLNEKELRLCYYFKLNLSAKEIANLEGLTDGSVRVYKTKIKAKLRVHPSESLTSYLRTFDRVA